MGSSSYITNANGDVSQHTEYFAFGETFVEEHKNSHNSPYKFNGKELDEESGLYYYGARYYDPKLSMWASVDPLAEEFPEWSPYNYCLNNPVILIDPDGRLPILPFILLAVYLLTPETAIAPTGNRSDGKAIGMSKAMKGNVLLSVSGAGLATKIASGSKRSTAKEKEVEKATEKESSKYEPSTKASRGKESVPNRKTDVKKEEFENNLIKEGYAESKSKDGKVNEYVKDGKKYTTRNESNNGPTADFRNNETTKKVDLKIRLGDLNKTQ